MSELGSVGKVPITIVTGFLGAGKTTVLRHLLEHSGGRRLGVIVNEFGDVGVDGTLLRDCADEDCPLENIVELANGCLCCTVAEDFVPTIEALLSQASPPEHIVVETSGLALPKPLLNAFDWPALRSRITVDGVVAVVDTEAVAAGRFAADPARVAAQREADESIDHDTPLGELFEDQIGCSDLVLLTKTDLAGEHGLEMTRAAIAASAPKSLPIVVADEGIVDPRIVLGLEAAAEDDLAARRSHHDDADDHEHDDFATITVDPGEIDEPAAFAERIAACATRHDILRVKGHVAVRGKPMRLLVQAVGRRVRHQYVDAWPPGERVSRLVVIAQAADLDEASVRRALVG